MEIAIFIIVLIVGLLVLGMVIAIFQAIFEGFKALFEGIFEIFKGSCQIAEETFRLCRKHHLKLIHWGLSSIACLLVVGTLGSIYGGKVSNPIESKRDIASASGSTEQVTSEYCKDVKETLENYINYQNLKSAHGMQGFWDLKLEQAHGDENIYTGELLQKYKIQFEQFNVYESEVQWDSLSLTEEDYGCKALFSQRLKTQKTDGSINELKLASSYKFNTSNKIFSIIDHEKESSQKEEVVQEEVTKAIPAKVIDAPEIKIAPVKAAPGVKGIAKIKTEAEVWVDPAEVQPSRDIAAKQPEVLVESHLSMKFEKSTEDCIGKREILEKFFWHINSNSINGLSGYLSFHLEEAFAHSRIMKADFLSAFYDSVIKKELYEEEVYWDTLVLEETHYGCQASFHHRLVVKEAGEAESRAINLQSVFKFDKNSLIFYFKDDRK